MLKKLRFNVGTPTARDFLEALSLRVYGFDHVLSCGADFVVSLAELLLQLTLGEINLHHRFPHAVLAASTLALALYTVHAPSAAYVALLEDLALHVPDASAPFGIMVQCCDALHLSWVRSVGGGDDSKYVQFLLCNKFARVSHHAVASTAPPSLPPPAFPPLQAWPSSREIAGQDKLEDAINAVHQSLKTEEKSCYTKCSRCHRTWYLLDHVTVCPECNSAVEPLEDLHWASLLSMRLRGPAEASFRVHSVLARHGWSNSHFRKPPDRETLLRDLVRACRKRYDKDRPTQQTLTSSMSITYLANAPVTFGCRSTTARRGRRSASWCGQRCTSRAPRSCATRSP